MISCIGLLKFPLFSTHMATNIFMPSQQFQIIHVFLRYFYVCTHKFPEYFQHFHLWIPHDNMKFSALSTCCNAKSNWLTTNEHNRQNFRKYLVLTEAYVPVKHTQGMACMKYRTETSCHWSVFPDSCVGSNCCIWC